MFGWIVWGVVVISAFSGTLLYIFHNISIETEIKAAYKETKEEFSEEMAKDVAREIAVLSGADYFVVLIVGILSLFLWVILFVFWIFDWNRVYLLWAMPLCFPAWYCFYQLLSDIVDPPGESRGS